MELVLQHVHQVVRSADLAKVEGGVVVAPLVLDGAFVVPAVGLVGLLKHTRRHGGRHILPWLKGKVRGMGGRHTREGLRKLWSTHTYLYCTMYTPLAIQPAATCLNNSVDSMRILYRQKMSRQSLRKSDISSVQQDTKKTVLAMKDGCDPCRPS
jgi:hypothetical protein